MLSWLCFKSRTPAHGMMPPTFTVSPLSSVKSCCLWVGYTSIFHRHTLSGVIVCIYLIGAGQGFVALLRKTLIIHRSPGENSISPREFRQWKSQARMLLGSAKNHVSQLLPGPQSLLSWNRRKYVKGCPKLAVICCRNIHSGTITLEGDQ